MSMISAQIDGLREMAGKLESYDQGYGTICQALRDAADTIWQLRDDLQRANAENAKLRSELESVGTAAYLYGRTDLADENDKLRTQLADVTESIGRMEERCAKLRELLQRTWDAFHDATAREFITVKNELRELGVEVDG